MVRYALGDELRQAAWDGALDACYAILMRGCDVNDRAPAKGKWRTGVTALHVAAGKGHSGIIGLLLEFRAEITIKDKRAEMPMHHACLGGCPDVVLMLLETERAKPRARVFRLPAYFALTDAQLLLAVNSGKTGYAALSEANKVQDNDEDKGSLQADGNPVEFVMAEFGARHARVKNITPLRLTREKLLAEPTCVKGRVAIVQRTGRDWRFVDMAHELQGMGASALVVLNKAEEPFAITMPRSKEDASRAEGVSIPVVSVGSQDARRLASATGITLIFSQPRRTSAHVLPAVAPEPEPNLEKTNRRSSLGSEGGDEDEDDARSALGDVSSASGSTPRSTPRGTDRDFLAQDTSPVTPASPQTPGLFRAARRGQRGYHRDPHASEMLHRAMRCLDKGNFGEASRHIQEAQDLDAIQTARFLGKVRLKIETATGSRRAGDTGSSSTPQLSAPPRGRRRSSSASVASATRAGSAASSRPRSALRGGRGGGSGIAMSEGPRPTSAQVATRKKVAAAKVELGPWLESIGLAENAEPLGSDAANEVALLPTGFRDRVAGEDMDEDCPQGAQAPRSAMLRVPTLAGDSCLHLAAMHNHAEVVQLILQYGAPTELRNVHQRTPLHEAIQGRFDEVVALLLEHGADALATTPEGDTPLHIAARSGDDAVAHRMIRGLIASLPEQTSVEAARRLNKRGYSPIHVAQAHDHTGALRLLMGSLGPAQFFKTRAEARRVAI